MAKNEFKVASIFKIITRIFKKKSFVGKHPNIHNQKMSVHFLYFLFKGKRVNPTKMSKKIYRK